MRDGAKEDLATVLARLRTRFAGTAPAIVTRLEALADQLDRNPADASALEPLVREMHRVHGTAGSHGFHEASALAAEMERTATAWLAESRVNAAGRPGVTAAGAEARAEGGAEARSEGGAKARSEGGAKARADQVRAVARALALALRDPGAGPP